VNKRFIYRRAWCERAGLSAGVPYWHRRASIRPSTRVRT